MLTVLIICIVIVIVVMLLAVLTTSKAYSFKHSVDPIEHNPHLDETEENKHKSEQ